MIFDIKRVFILYKQRFQIYSFLSATTATARLFYTLCTLQNYEIKTKVTALSIFFTKINSKQSPRFLNEKKDNLQE